MYFTLYFYYNKKKNTHRINKHENYTTCRGESRNFEGGGVQTIVKVIYKGRRDSLKDGI